MFSTSPNQESDKKSAVSSQPPTNVQSSPNKSSIKKATTSVTSKSTTSAGVSQAGNLSSESFLQSLAGASGSSLASSSALSNAGLMDPSFLAMLPNPYINPLSMMGGATGGVDASSLYQQQLMGWMQSALVQSALAQSYVLSGFSPSFFPSPSASSGNRNRSGAKSSNRPGGKAKIETSQTGAGIFPSGKSTASTATTPASSSTTTSSMRTSFSDVTSAKTTGSVNRSDPIATSSRSTGETQSSSKLSNEAKVTDKSNRISEYGGKPRTSSSQKVSSSRSSNKLIKGSVSSPLDVMKFSGLLSPFDTSGLLGKLDVRTSGKSTRTKEPTSVIDFPINLGREITVTATGSSKSNITHSVPIPGSSSAAGKTKSSHSLGHSSSSSASHFLAHSHQLLGSNFSKPDPQSLAFSVLQNLPSSMSLLVKSNNPGSLAQPYQPSKQSSSPLDFTSKTFQNQLPKLTPAPGFQGSHKKKSLANLSQPHLTSLKTSSQSSSLSKNTNPHSSSVPIKVAEPHTSSGDDDVVVLD